MTDEPSVVDEPLGPELASLFGEERVRPEPAADAARARMLSRLEAALPAAAAPALAAKLGPLLAALVLGGAIGAGVTAKLAEPKVVYVDRAVAVAAPSPPPAETIVLPVSTRAAPEASAASAPAPSVAPSDTLARERAILDPARTALAKGDATTALAATERHLREFPRGQMAEEREALAVQSLAKLGRTSEAKARGEEFKVRYPNSVLLGAVDSVTDSQKGTK